MRILYDDKIPLAKESFSLIGDTVSFSGRQIPDSELKKADALIVRSTTPVTPEVLNGSSIQFVGTATSGSDHIDLDYLNQRGIHFAVAVGCNANSVAEYVITALAHLDSIQKIKLPHIRLGIVGVGHVGSRVAQKAQALGIDVKLYDPPRQLAEPETRFDTFEAILDCDVVTLHVPLVRKGVYPTVRLFDESVLSQLDNQAVLINTSRGEVVDEACLMARLKQNQLNGAVIDVWQHEPTINTDLLELVDIGTPHIAGHTIDGKYNGTRMMLRALKAFYQVDCPEPLGFAELDALRFQVDATFDIRKEDQRFRQILDLSSGQQALFFEQYRQNYEHRYEWHHFSTHPSWVNRLKNL